MESWDLRPESGWSDASHHLVYPEEQVLVEEGKRIAAGGRPVHLDPAREP